MSDNSKIGWTDATWNVVLGCDRVSSGCDGCYAIRTARRMSANPDPKVSVPYTGLVEVRDGRLDWTGRVNLVPDRLDWPLHWVKPRRIFVNAQSDLFHADVPDEFIGSVFEVMAKAPQHTFQILTKRPGRMRSLLNRWGAEGAGKDWAGTGTAVFRRADMSWVGPVRWPLPNVWLGISVEDQKTADLRIPQLLDTPAAVRWVSAEPLLGPLDLAWSLGGHWRCPGCGFDQGSHMGGTTCVECKVRTYPPPYRSLDWVVVGGESGPDARVMPTKWAESLVDQCGIAGVPVFVKQMGSVWARDITVGGVSVYSRGDRKGEDPQWWDAELRVQEYPAVTV